MQRAVRRRDVGGRFPGGRGRGENDRRRCQPRPHHACRARCITPSSACRVVMILIEHDGPRLAKGRTRRARADTTPPCHRRSPAGLAPLQAGQAGMPGRGREPSGLEAFQPLSGQRDLGNSTIPDGRPRVLRNGRNRPGLPAPARLQQGAPKRTHIGLPINVGRHSLLGRESRTVERGRGCAKERRTVRRPIEKAAAPWSDHRLRRQQMGKSAAGGGPPSAARAPGDAPSELQRVVDEPMRRYRQLCPRARRRGELMAMRRTAPAPQSVGRDPVDEPAHSSAMAGRASLGDVKRFSAPPSKSPRTHTPTVSACPARPEVAVGNLHPGERGT